MSAVALASLVSCRSVGAHEVAWVDDVIEVSSGAVCFLSTLAVGGATVGQYLFRRDQTELLPDIVQD